MIEWSEWIDLSPTLQFTPDALRETLDGGQCFRWTFRKEENEWIGIWGGNLARIRQIDTSELQTSMPAKTQATAAQVERFLGGQTNWDELIDSLPWRSDPHLKACLDAFAGLRILKQPFAETLLAFLCSATKQIPQIKVMCERLAASLGSEITPGFHSLPTWSQLAATDELTLRGLGLGFRAKNIKRTADILANDPQRLAEIEAAPYEIAKQQLVELPGVGEKIADCALLFGAGKLEAFPVDTWIIKVLEKRYQLLGWTPSQLAQFGRVHFGPYAGFAQQFLFSYERSSTQRLKGVFDNQ